MIPDYIRTIDHIGIPSKDIDSAIAFYRRLGFSLVGSEVVPETNASAAFMAIDGLVLEIYQENETAACAGAIDHIAINVTSIDKLYNEIREAGIKIVSGIEELPFWENGIRFFKILAPDSVVIEFCERLQK